MSTLPICWLTEKGRAFQSFCLLRWASEKESKCHHSSSLGRNCISVKSSQQKNYFWQRWKWWLPAYLPMGKHMRLRSSRLHKPEAKENVISLLRLNVLTILQCVWRKMSSSDSPVSLTKQLGWVSSEGSGWSRMNAFCNSVTWECWASTREDMAHEKHLAHEKPKLPLILGHGEYLEHKSFHHFLYHVSWLPWSQLTMLGK